MLTVWERDSASGGVSRRELLRIGALGLGGMTLPGLLAARAKDVAYLVLCLENSKQAEIEQMAKQLQKKQL